MKVKSTSDQLCNQPIQTVLNTHVRRKRGLLKKRLSGGQTMSIVPLTTSEYSQAAA